MNLYKISQSVNNGYDTYDSAVVAAESEEQAKTIHPADYVDVGDDQWFKQDYHYGQHSWAMPIDVKVGYIGEARPGLESGVICASFNAG